MLHSTHTRVTIKSSITTVLMAVVMLLFLSSCVDDKVEGVEKLNREELPRLTAANITTIISDSGVTRYRITTPQWKVYDKTEEPYWIFPEGIVFERFDEFYKVDAEMKSDSALFLEQKSLWEFIGNVKAKNSKGEYFETEQMFWDEKNDKIYSTKEIKITQESKIINGVGFESNSNLTNYTIRNPKGVIPLDKEDTDK